MGLIGLCILNHEDRKDRKEKMLAHLAAEQLDRVMDREEVAHHIVDSAVAIHESARARIAGVRVSALPDV